MDKNFRHRKVNWSYRNRTFLCSDHWLSTRAAHDSLLVLKPAFDTIRQSRIAASSHRNLMVCWSSSSHTKITRDKTVAWELSLISDKCGGCNRVPLYSTCFCSSGSSEDSRSSFDIPADKDQRCRSVQQDSQCP